jgi:hypothetical protein
LCYWGATQSVVQLSVTLFSFLSRLTFTIERQNKFLSLVTTFGCRRRGRRMDEVPNSTNAWTLCVIIALADEKWRFPNFLQERETMNPYESTHQ